MVPEIVIGVAFSASRLLKMQRSLLDGVLNDCQIHGVDELIHHSFSLGRVVEVEPAVAIAQQQIHRLLVANSQR